MAGYELQRPTPLAFGKFTTSSDHDNHEYDDDEEEEDHTDDENDNNVTFTLQWRYLERRMRSAAEERGNAVQSRGYVSCGGEITEEWSLRR